MSTLSEISTKAPKEFDKKEAKELAAKLIAELDELQNLLYAERKHSILIVLQGLDASGKDGAIRKVFGQMNPQGVRVQSFKAPTEEELAHDFLWRVHEHTPEKGMIQIFNRSHYEDVLITRVHKWCDDATAAKRFDLLVGTRFLRAEIIGGNAYNHQTLALVGLVELLKARVLRRVSALAGNIHQQHDLPFERRERRRRAVNRTQREIVNARSSKGHRPDGQTQQHQFHHVDQDSEPPIPPAIRRFPSAGVLTVYEIAP